MRLEQETSRRSNAPVIITTVLSLLVVTAAVAAVAWLVFRTPSEAVDSAERLEPVGTALPAPTEAPTLPTPIPTQVSAPAPGFTGEAQVSGLPTVEPPQEQIAPAVAQDAGPTPTPRVVALPTAPPTDPPPTLPPMQPAPQPAPTLPPAVPVEVVPVVALEPVEVAQPAPVAAAERPEDDAERERGAASPAIDDDPFNIFGDRDENGSGIAPAQNDALDRARALQDDAEDGDGDRGRSDPVDVPAIVPAEAVTITERGDGSREIVVNDVDAMIDEITASVTDPNRNPNVGDDGRDDDRNRDQGGRDRDEDNRAQDENGGNSDRSRGSNARGSSATGNRARSVRERINDRVGRDSSNGPNRNDNDSGGGRGGQDNGEDPSDDCFPFC
jgi:hypothetical protein